MEKGTKLILIRHGKSQWNQKNRFTGWVDIPLSKEGIVEAQEAGRCIRAIPFGVIFVSALMRAQQTAMIAMAEHESGKTPCLHHEGNGRLEQWAQIHDKKAQELCIPVFVSEELNERMYGELQGLEKDETRKKFGADQVKLWRRSFRTPPPGGESLEGTAERTLPYFKERILPFLESGTHVLVSAHGNSLRSLSMYIEQLSEDEVVNLEIPTGEPICYNYAQGKWTKEPIDDVQNAFRNLSR